MNRLKFLLCSCGEDKNRRKTSSRGIDVFSTRIQQKINTVHLKFMLSSCGEDKNRKKTSIPCTSLTWRCTLHTGEKSYGFLPYVNTQVTAMLWAGSSISKNTQLHLDYRIKSCDLKHHDCLLTVMAWRWQYPRMNRIITEVAWTGSHNF